MVNTTQVGTDLYMAPEVRSSKSYVGHAADLFSAAIILFIMASGRTPFMQSMLSDNLYKLIMENRFNGFWLEQAKHQVMLPYDLTQLINSLLIENPIF